jgi:FkbM family methyltransferase
LWWTGIKGLGALRGAAYGWRALRGRSSVFFDVGARGGLQVKWRPANACGLLHTFIFEPDPAEAARLRATRNGVTVVEKALGDARRHATLTIYNQAGLSSVRKANRTVVSRYPYGQTFDEVGEVGVELHPLAELIENAEVPSPHFIKVDVQGFELEILKGLERHIDRVVAIELEGQFEEIYQQQPLFPEIYDWLRSRGFGMLAIRPQWIMDYNIFEVNGFFARNPATLNEDDRRRHRMWRLVNRIGSPEEVSLRGY